MNIQVIKDQLKEAIDKHLVIEVLYKNDTEFRSMNPYHYGVFGENENLQAFQTSGPSESNTPIGWKNPILSDIRSIRITDMEFTPPDKGYNPSSTQYKSIEHQIKYDGMGPGRKRTKP